MQVIKRLAIFSIFSSSLCLGGIPIEKTKRVNSSLIQEVVKILQSCFGDRITPVGLAGNLTGMISESLSSQGNFPVTLIDAEAKLVANSSLYPQSPYKLQVFVIVVSSPEGLTRILGGLKSSIWWNHMAHFLILDISSSDLGCSNTFELLWTAWDMNILNANLMCHDRSSGRLIYTFNPFTNQAPYPWRFVKTYTGSKINHPWTLFVYEYEENYLKMCNGLNFDKTSDLGGYEIRFSVPNATYGYKLTKTHGICSGPYWDIFCDVILPALNVTPKVTVYPSLASVGFVDQKGKVTGILGEAANGSIDFSPAARFVTSMLNLKSTYPVWQSDLHSATQYSGYKSQLSKIVSVIDRTSRLCLLAVCFVTLLFFKYFIAESTTIALLSTLRLICNSSLTMVPGNPASRVYLGSLFIFVVTMQGIYQGKFASLLTHDEPLPNVNSMTDLIDFNPKVYGFQTYSVYFPEVTRKGNFVGINSVNCTMYPVKNAKAACVATSFFLLYEAVEYKLHMSSEVLARVHEALPIRPDWPLEDRVNDILLRSIDTHRIQYLRDNLTHKYTRRLEFQRNSYKDPVPKVLTLEQLSFAFVILVAGLVCATISFIIEVSVG